MTIQREKYSEVLINIRLFILRCYTYSLCLVDEKTALAKEAAEYARLMNKIRQRVLNKKKPRKKKSAKDVTLDTRPSSVPRLHPHKWVGIMGKKLLFQRKFGGTLFSEHYKQ